MQRKGIPYLVELFLQLFDIFDVWHFANLPIEVRPGDFDRVEVRVLWWVLFILSEAI